MCYYYSQVHRKQNLYAKKVDKKIFQNSQCILLDNIFKVVKTKKKYHHHHYFSSRLEI